MRSVDGHGIGTVVDERGDCVVIETGTIAKKRHAVPRSFLHEGGEELSSTVTKEIFDASPTIESDDWSCEEICLHYGLGGPYVMDPDPELGGPDVERPESQGQPDPARRLATLGGENDPTIERASRFDRR